MNQTPDPIKSSEGANKTLNRLVAGDFLESLGKELGLEVPPDNRPGPSLNANNVSLSEQKESPKGGDDRDYVALTKAEETKSKDYGSTVDSSREKKRSHSRHRRRRSRTRDSDSDSDSGRGHSSKSKRRRDERDKSRSPDGESSDEAYLHRKEPRKKHHSRRHHEHKRKDYGDKYSDKKRRS